MSKKTQKSSIFMQNCLPKKNELQSQRGSVFDRLSLPINVRCDNNVSYSRFLQPITGPENGSIQTVRLKRQQLSLQVSSNNRCSRNRSLGIAADNCHRNLNTLNVNRCVLNRCILRKGHSSNIVTEHVLLVVAVVD